MSDCLDPGTYYVTVYPSGPAGGVPCSSADYWISLDCQPCLPCPECDPAVSILENEPCPNLIDHYNGGCVGGSVYTFPVQCGDQLCGTSDSGPGYNDLDVYEINLTSYDSVSWCVYANFNGQIRILEPLTGGCGPTITWATAEMTRCETTCIGACLPPGEYWLTVLPYGLNVECTLDPYTAEVNCYPCTPCEPCPVTAIQENEPCPSQWDIYNGGCTSYPPVGMHVECGDTICGMGIMQDWPDNDFYEITLTSVDSVIWCVTADFPIMTGIYTPALTCPAMAVHAVGSALACQQICISACLNPGTYWLRVAANGPTGFVCKPYVASVQCIPCLSVPPDTCPYPTQDFEPTDDSCPQTTSVFGCPDTLCGRIQTGAGAPDRDWYNITIPGPSCRSATINCYADDAFGWYTYGQGLNPRIALFQSDCTTLLGFDDSSGVGDDAAMVTPCLPPGTYKLLVQGVGLSTGPYVLTMRCSNCACPCDISCGSYSLDGEICPNITGPDSYNGGCTSGLTPPPFGFQGCNQGLCATSFAMGGIVDHDWYTFTLLAPRRINWRVRAEFPFQMQLLRPTPDCSNLVTIRDLTGNPCQTKNAFVLCLAAGTYYLHVTPTVTNGIPCSQYTSIVQCGKCFIIDVVLGHGVPFNPHIKLAWSSDPTEPIFNIYRSRTPDFTPGPNLRIGSTSDTTFIDTGILNNPSEKFFYLVTMEEDTTGGEQP